MSCRGSWGHLFVYTILHKQCAVNHLRCRRGDADLHHNGGGSAHIKRRGQMPFHFALAFQSVLMPAIFFPSLRRDTDADVWYCAAPAVPAQLLLANHGKKKNSTMSWEGEKKNPPPSKTEENKIKNYFNPTSIFSQQLSAKYFFTIRNKENPITYFLFFTGAVASDGLSTAVVTTLFAASIKVTYKLFSQGLKEMSIRD